MLTAPALAFSPNWKRLGAEVAPEAAQDEANFAITDRGPGIPPELLARVFKPFFPADLVRRQAVLGVNLAIAKEIICSRGGRIEIVNRPERSLLYQGAFEVTRGIHEKAEL